MERFFEFQLVKFGKEFPPHIRYDGNGGGASIFLLLVAIVEPPREDRLEWRYYLRDEMVGEVRLEDETDWSDECGGTLSDWILTSGWKLLCWTLIWITRGGPV